MRGTIGIVGLAFLAGSVGAVLAAFLYQSVVLDKPLAEDSYAEWDIGKAIIGLTFTAVALPVLYMLQRRAYR